MGGFFVSDRFSDRIFGPMVGYWPATASDRFFVVDFVVIFSLKNGILTIKFGAITPFLDVEKCSNSP